jgi:hypothetical protein
LLDTHNGQWSYVWGQPFLSRYGYDENNMWSQGQGQALAGAAANNFCPRYNSS